MSMRIGGSSRRSRDTGFQWLIIGIILGMGCSFTLMLGLYVFEIIEVTPLEDTSEPTAVVVVSPPPTATASLTPESEVPDTQTDTDDRPSVDTTPTTPVEETAADAIDDTNASPTDLPGPTVDTSTTSENTDIGTGTGVGGDSVSELPASNPTPTVGFAIGGNGGGESETDDSSAADITDTLPTTEAPGLNPAPTTAPAAVAPSIPTSPLVTIQGGLFLMGTTEEDGRREVADCVTLDSGLCDYDTQVADSVPPHQVLVDDFQMEQFEVSVSQYIAFLNFVQSQNPDTISPHLSACNGGPCAVTTSDPEGIISDIAYDPEARIYSPRADTFDRRDMPVTHVSWEGAKAYCAAIGRRLPTEAEWERAARGPGNNQWPWGQQWNPRDDRANTSRTGNVNAGLWTVNTGGTESLTPDGLYNMAGNAVEWTADYFNATLYQQRFQSGVPAENPIWDVPGPSVVARGGAWDAVPMFARTVHRLTFAPITFSANLGFRCVADIQ